MALTGEHNLMLEVLLTASEAERKPTPGCPDGHSKWHGAYRLRTEGLGKGWTETDVHRVGAALQRRGLVAHRTTLMVTRWTLTEAGLAQARRLARSVAP
jgi:hypothetical protein